MPKFTEKRKKRLIRNPDGTFRKWMGGKTKAQLKKKENNFHGIAVHIGKEFKKQHRRVARIGECVRFKTKSGAYHQQAFWYIRTKNGWRKSPTGTRKPTNSQIQRINENSRKGR